MDGAAGGWRVVEGVELLCREWEGQLVLYHGGTGNTHLLDGEAAAVFKLLRAGQAPVRHLAACMKGGDGDGGCSEDGLVRILGALQRLDIVEPIGEAERTPGR
ncbi:MAG TPA: HPr-rel-A system PqqD family peptide chaperone [Gammaproteobacteria bacterium]|nr:HPr-rel-A system PqqD family peptide chaperone [Gammaproteobacteria bacterium]